MCFISCICLHTHSYILGTGGMVVRGVKEEHYAIYNENPNITVLGRTFMCVYVCLCN